MTHEAVADKAARDLPMTDKPQKVALIGHGIQLSRTPAMHRDAGRACGLEYRYDLIDTASYSEPPDIADLLDHAETEGYNGVNITHPYKQAAYGYLDDLSDAARSIGAVNTVVFRDGRRLGHNTDYWGFSEAFRHNLSKTRTDCVLLLGAGGAGSAVATALIDLGVRKLEVFDPDFERSDALIASMKSNSTALEIIKAISVEDALDRGDGLVNATPVGMAAHPGSPVPENALSPRHWVADIVYFPLETKLLATARAKGCRTMDGSGMAVFQAVRAFELFTGCKPDPDRMRASFDAAAPDNPNLNPEAGSTGT